MTQRQIKFRAWDKKDNRMIDLENCLIDAYGIIMFKEIMDGKHIDRYIPMQFTGLLDKNGKEIYEEDIVKETYRDETFDIGKVVFKDAMFSLYKENGDFIDSCEQEGQAHTVEVIGNIYQNPELLEQKI